MASSEVLTFFTGKKYKDAKNVLFTRIFHILNLNIVNTYVLLWGESAISDNENLHLFTSVYYMYYIINTDIFE